MSRGSYVGFDFELVFLWRMPFGVAIVRGFGKKPECWLKQGQQGYTGARGASRTSGSDRELSVGYICGRRTDLVHETMSADKLAVKLKRASVIRL